MRLRDRRTDPSARARIRDRDRSLMTMSASDLPRVAASASVRRSKPRKPVDPQEFYRSPPWWLMLPE